jgi:hypothetical protein
MTKLSRRDFLIGCTYGAAALAFNRWFNPQSVRTASSQGYPLVSVAEGVDEDTPAQMLQTALEGIGGIERFVMPGQTVAIKPNATWAYPPKTASSTDPDFLMAVIQAVRDAGAGRIIVMDHCSIEPGAEGALRISGIGRVVEEMGVEQVFPDRFNAPRNTYTKIDLPHGQAYQEIGVIKAAVDADVRINLAVAKVHNVTKMTMCLKHMMGFLENPGMLHAKLEQGIADLSTPSAIQVQLHFLEAIRVRMPFGGYRVCAGPETDLTDPQIVTRRNTIIAGVDPVLIDAYGCINFFDVQPEELTHLQRAYESGCGVMDVEAALADGRIRRFKVGELALPLAGDTPESTLEATTVVDETAAAATHSPGECPPSGQVIDPSPILNTALIPAAAIITGVGLVTLRHMRRRLPKDQQEAGEQQTGQGDPKFKDDHD